MSELEGLIARVEAAGGPDREVDLAIHWLLINDGEPLAVMGSFGIIDLPAYTSSLDAALKLVEAKLPGWDYLVARVSDGCSAEVGPPDSFQQIEAKAPTPALALILALLRALAQGGEKP